jgi:hypothetical protein
MERRIRAKKYVHLERESRSPELDAVAPLMFDDVLSSELPPGCRRHQPQTVEKAPTARL